MESYGGAYSYPDSGDSSPRSREIDFENPAAPSCWDDQPTVPLPPTHKVKFMVSYGGKIQPRHHDTSLSYVGGDTKILSVDRSIKFPSLLSKLASLLPPDDPSLSPSLSSFKYQLPGEDLDALISVTNDDDLDHLMHEYDRLFRTSPRPTRLRLFLFPSSPDRPLDHRDRFLDSLGPVPVPPGSVPVQDPINPGPPVPAPVVASPSPPPMPPPVVVAAPPPPPPTNNIDFLFGLEAGRAPPPPPPVKAHDPEIEARVQELSRMHLDREAEIYRRRSEDDAYQKQQQPPPPPPASSVQIPSGYWQQPVTLGLDHQQQLFHHHQQQQQQQLPPAQLPPQHQQQRPVYMVHAPQQGGVYHAQVVRPPAGYYQVSPGEQPVYSMPAPQGGVPAGARPVHGMGDSAHHHQMAYDGGRQVYYAAAAPGVVTAPFQGVSGDLRGLTNTSADGKVVVPKISPTSAAV